MLGWIHSQSAKVHGRRTLGQYIKGLDRLRPTSGPYGSVLTYTHGPRLSKNGRRVGLYQLPASRRRVRAGHCQWRQANEGTRLVQRRLEGDKSFDGGGSEIYFKKKFFSFMLSRFFFLLLTRDVGVDRLVGVKHLFCAPTTWQGEEGMDD
eukprot:scaffold765_cov160-Amphora_coffeaeformis.AAC.11